jgi:hypothetical protein
MKLISAAVAAIALYLSMILVPTAATAAPNSYPGSVTTNCAVAAPSPMRHHRVKMYYSVQAGNAVPSGNVRLRLYKRTSTGVYKVIRNPLVLNEGGPQKFVFRHLGRGSYRVNYRFKPSAESVFKPCASATLHVRVTR